MPGKRALVDLGDDWWLLPLTRDYYAFVSTEDVERVSHFNWQVLIKPRNAYSQARINGKLVYLHRFVLGLTDPAVKVDHINHDGLDCRRGNLRSATCSQNCMNTRKGRSGTSQYKGVYWVKAVRAWQSKIRCYGTVVYVGTYHSEIEAARAYNEKARELFGEFAWINPLPSS